MDDQRELVSARVVYMSLGYAKWENFDGLVSRACNLIANGEAAGVIRCTTIPITIGSGAVRRVRDYLLDEQAIKLVSTLSSSMKLNGRYSIRNECVILRLLAKYCKARNIHFEFQKRCRGFVFDAVVAHLIAVEFDEPHHAKNIRQVARDKTKDAVAIDSGLTMLRFTLAQDIVDVILAVESALRKRVPTASVAGSKGGRT